jgi:pyruvate/2-oxoglutarate dehydrogenase complex dihydrolipoamide acyltransferase (E2) component
MTNRKTVEVARKRVPLRKLLHGKEIREAAAALESFRLNLNEAEFLYGAKITLTMDSYGECIAVAKRPETDKEYAGRVEKARIAAEQKAERERKRQEAAALKAAWEEANKRARAAETIRKIAQEHGITVLVDNC